MTHERNLDRVLDRWMDEGPTIVADRVIATAMTDVHTTRQRGARWAPLKELFMTMKPATTALAIITIAALGIAAYQFVLGGGPSTGNDAPATPTPRVFEDASGSLEPGTYVSSIDSIEVTYTVPAGWGREPSAPELGGPIADEIGGLSFWIVQDLFADPCRFDEGALAPPPGPTVDDLANALVEQPGVDAEPPTDVVVDGFAGRYVEYTTPADCAQFGPWQTENGVVLFASSDVRYWILEVDGTRLVMLAYLWDGATQEGRAELQAIIDSVEITP
jgi:hypothetical protein